MAELVAALVSLMVGGLAAVALRRRPGLCQVAGQSGAVAGAVLGLAGAVRVLVAGRPESLAAAWQMPGGSLHLELDLLSAFFLLPIFGLLLSSALYGRAYLAEREGSRGVAGCWFHMNVLGAGMALVVVAHDGLLFLLAWEVMALSPFFLVILDDSDAAVRHAAWTYLTATHLGTAFLLVMFVLLGGLAGTSDFDAYAGALRAHPELSSLVFVLALIGFGSKAGVVPAHVWLPEAHPAAPSHVSALMSGAMITVGIYGLLRMLTLLGTPPAWWGWVLLAMGALSGVLGVVFALTQRDLKRLLAYSSVENIGIVLIGLGLGLLARSAGAPQLAIVAFAAALLHILNHAVFKGLLFLGAGAVQHGAHTLDFERLGGLLKRMPGTAAMFLVGATAIVGLPPLNGFFGEFLLFLSGLAAVLQPNAALAAGGIAALSLIGLIGGLGAAAFAKAFGIVFLGSPRSPKAASAHDAPPMMLAAMAILGVLCVFLGFAAPVAVPALGGVVATATGLRPDAVQAQLASIALPLRETVLVFAILIAVAAFAWAVRARQLGRAGVRRGPVWGCGYLFPSARMQYTASSFVEPLTTQFRFLAHVREHAVKPHGYFPSGASYRSDSGDPLLQLLFAPTFRWFDRMAARLNVIQHGHTHIYVLYVAATLVGLLVWASL